MKGKEWGPIPQRKPLQDQPQLEIPVYPYAPKKEKKPRSPHEMGEDITPEDSSGYIDYGEA